MPQLSENKTRILARIIRDVLRGGPFESLADLTADVKARCARLRIRVDADDLNDAYRLIESNAALTVDAPRLPAREPTAADRPGELSAADARDVLADVRKRLAVDRLAPKRMPTAPLPIPRRKLDALRVLRMVADAERADRRKDPTP